MTQQVIANMHVDDAVSGLRALGPRGLELMLAVRDASDLSEEELTRVNTAIDRIAGQRYGSISKLYWYTDLEQAKSEAAKLNRQIVSLRMLGNLTDELSCANSRFFRTILYVHPDIASELATNFVLHWSSERDAPVITIDFGDGRKIRRTVTGNSAHYILNADGRVLDVIPGLYSPKAFLERLAWAKKVTPPNATALHALRAREIEGNWQADQRLAIASGRGRSRVPAKESMEIALGKFSVEAPLVMSPSELARINDDDVLDALTSLIKSVELSPRTVELIRAENPELDVRTVDTMVETLKRSVLRDTLQNENLLQPRIHARLAEERLPNFETFNRWVYTEIFATPASDPWLGLHDETIYTGLEGAGITVQ